MIRLFALVLVLLSAACVKVDQPETATSIAPTIEGSAPEDGGGRRYIDALFEAVRTSDRIVVKEHSDVYDVLFLEPDTDKWEQVTKDYSPTLYATRELTDKDRASFLDTIKAMAPRTQNGYCVHFRITPYDHVPSREQASERNENLLQMRASRLGWDHRSKSVVLDTCFGENDFGFGNGAESRLVGAGKSKCEIADA